MNLQILENINKLKLYLFIKDKKPTHFAKEIGFSAATITNYLAGRGRLGKHAALIIELKTDGDLTQEDILKFNPATWKKRKQKLLEYKGPIDI